MSFAARSLATLRPAATAAASAGRRSVAAPAATKSLTFSRGYADAGKPPVQLFGVDGTYATALYTAASKTSTLDGTAKALSTLKGNFKSDAKLATVLSAPTLSASDKSQIIEQLLKTSGVSASSKEGATVKNFLNTLAENNRLGVLGGVCDKFEELTSAAKGEIELRVTSAEELDRRVLQKIEAAVSKSRLVGQGRKLKLVTRVQPDIRGGLIVEIGDRTVDLSVSGKLSRMNQLLNEAL